MAIGGKPMAIFVFIIICVSWFIIAGKEYP